MDSDKNAAPARISAIIAEVRVAPMRLSVKVLQLSDPWPAARVSEPITPKAAASVAVANPIYIDPMTRAMSRSTGIRKREFFTFSEKDICGSGVGLKSLAKRE